MNTAPDLPTRVERSLLSIFTDAFPSVALGVSSQPVKRGERSIGIKADQQAENPQGTNLHDVEITIEGRNLEFEERELLRRMIGNSRCALATLTERATKQFQLPKGDPVEVSGPEQTVEDENERIVSYTLTASIQPT